MRRQLLLTSVAVIAVAAYFNTNSGSTLWICATPQADDLNQAGYEALTWVQVKGVGNHGEVGTTTNILQYDTWDSDFAQKGKGMSNAGDPEVELTNIPTDPGQVILTAAALTKYFYAFKIIRNDAVSESSSPSVKYNRGLVVGPRDPLGRNEDFDLKLFTLGLVQRQITVNPTSAGNPPVETVAPAITGTAQVNEVLTVSNGTFTGDATITYTRQWYAGGVAITGATNATFVVTTTQLGKVITARVRATNNAGYADGFAAPTAAVIA